MNVPRVVSGRYEIGELLGRGGMADVYMARDLRLGRTVAIKLLRGDVARDAQLKARFRREAQAVAGLNHPSIVAVYDTGEHFSGDPLGDGAKLPYIVMEYVSRKTLRDLVRADSITMDQAIDFTLGVLSALEYSHRAGIVHRDIKPANVMVVEDAEGHPGGVKVMDFGIARTLSDSAATMTQTQTVMGTAQYLSPEQARGESVDARSDLYSAGCLFYEMLAGRPPFTGDSPVSVAYQHVRELPPPPSSFKPEVSPALDSVLLKALQKDRKDRFQDAASFRRALRAARTGVTLASPVVPAVTDPLDAVAAPVPRPLAASPVAVAAAGGYDDGGPATRAMAKVLAGGALTTDDGGASEGPEEPDRGVRRRRRAWVLTLFVFLAMILAGGGYIGWNLLNAKPPPPVQVSIPDVAKMNEIDATTKLLEAGLDPKPTTEYSQSVAAGDVIGTDPPSGGLLSVHSSIVLLVSKGPSEVKIPTDLAGRTESEVRAELSTLNLVFEPNDFVDDPTIQANLVVTTDPKPGETVPVGQRITLKISTGEVAMPSLFDLTADPAKVQQAVRDALHKASPLLQATFEYQTNTAVAPGMVTGQSESAGTEVPQRTLITVTLAKAPEKPTPTPTPPKKGRQPTTPPTPRGH
ncbi:Stk1 family PASTA domain-containing Ser/Thr kinase [Arthrobacter wenxiniae]|jgi:serine/threonine-protein kinase|uniref:non-specific serine/threonine protein kinase n=1 Tax=Arthrobacter wenxiniae TaxID=2713570 RepID=A0A7Y7M1C6_9MICC|nr:Stk1 family PASTA domain-containing Ser/Thr kinase [Arthrobacter wenxiniae]NVM96608.1 Stk1 family PASTA domain-containing Ser/Thr kinase [Arthrobacter wenxiniae]